jgi:hypothetical protein
VSLTLAPAGHAARLGGLLRRHWLISTLIGLGLVLRILVMIGYPRGLWLFGDSQEYTATAFNHTADYIRPSGYGVFLTFFVWARSTKAILAFQHLLGLGIAGFGYAFLQRRGVSRVVAAIAMAPLLFDGRTLTLEHYILAETFFTSLLVAGVLLLLWRERPGLLECALVGFLFAAAAVTRSIGLLVLLAPILYLVVRRLGWRQFVAFGAAVSISLGAYVGWYHAGQHEWGFSGYSGHFLWARTTTFMDCSKLQLQPAEVRICPTEPLGHRPTPDAYLWTSTSVHKIQTKASDTIHMGLAIKAIETQPGDYLATVVHDTWAMMLPGIPDGTSPCTLEYWQLPPEGPSECAIRLAPANPATGVSRVYATTDLHGPLVAPLHAYAVAATLPAGVTGLAFLFTLILAVVRPRRSMLRDWLDPLLLSTVAFGMIVASVATAAIDTRYAAPSLPLGLLGAALAWARLRAVTRPDLAIPTVPAQTEPLETAPALSRTVAAESTAPDA